MGSVQSYDECPNCKFEYAIYDYYYKSNEEYVFCERCGYSMNINPEETETSGGFGAFRVMYETGGGVSGSFIDKDGFDGFLEEFNEHGLVSESGKKPTHVSCTFQQDGEWFMKDLITNKVEPFSNFFMEAEKDE